MEFCFYFFLTPEGFETNATYSCEIMVNSLMTCNSRWSYETVLLFSTYLLEYLLVNCFIIVLNSYNIIIFKKHWTKK